MTPYFSELRSQWRPLAAAVLGLSSGLTVLGYVFGIMGPFLIGEFGWSKSEFALISTMAIIAVFVFPVVGRLADVLGVRKTAAIGVIACPVILLATTTATGLYSYALLFAVQMVILGTTTAPVYCRLIVQYFHRARGLALGIAAAGPAVVGAIGGPLLNNFVADHGWRSGFVAVAVFTAIGGATALALIPRDRGGVVAKRTRPKTAKADYARIFRTPAFWIIFAAILLGNLPQTVFMAQLTLVLAENGAPGKDGSIMISAFAVGTLVGRLVSGVALDRFPAPIVAAVGMALSGVGLLGIASGFDTRPMLFSSVLLFGLSLGAEADVIAYLIVRNFGVRIYGSVHGMLASTISITAVIGAILMSAMVKTYGIYAPFLWLTGGLGLIASLLFLLLPRNPQVEDDAPETDEERSAADGPRIEAHA
jgi:MFS family permease